MSLFRKPKKPIQRRVFSGYDDEDEENHNASGKSDNGPHSVSNGSDNGSDINRPVPMELDPAPEGPVVAVVPTGSEHRKRKEHRAESSSKGSLKAIPSTKPSLLSFDDEGNKKHLF